MKQIRDTSKSRGSLRSNTNDGRTKTNYGTKFLVKDILSGNQNTSNINSLQQNKNTELVK